MLVGYEVRLIVEPVSADDLTLISDVQVEIFYYFSRKEHSQFQVPNGIGFY